jgi:hypothetical protein
VWCNCNLNNASEIASVVDPACQLLPGPHILRKKISHSNLKNLICFICHNVYNMSSEKTQKIMVLLA